MPPIYRIILSPEAAADLEQIHAYISRESPENAVKVVERILDEIATLETFSHR